MMNCTSCDVELSSQNAYYRKRKSGKVDIYRYCKKCFNRCVVRRQTANKLACIEFLGGKCVDCGIDNPIVLDFHHLDPSIKEGSISKMKSRSVEKLLEEVGKCALLCANCHRIRHCIIMAEDIKIVKERGYFKKEKISNICGCGQKIFRGSKTCRRCVVRKTKIAWPPDDVLSLLIKKHSGAGVGKMLGVSGAAVLRRCKKQNILVSKAKGA